MTGYYLSGTPTVIQDRQAELEALHREIFGETQEKPQEPSRPTIPLDLSDQELIDKAHRGQFGDEFAALWRGDISRFDNDDSKADYHLCKSLAWWTGKDPDRMDRVFRQSGLRRPKWDRRTGGTTYGARTIEKAIVNTKGCCEGPRRDRDNGGKRPMSAAKEGTSIKGNGGADPQAQEQETQGKTGEPEFTEAELLNFARDGEVGDARLFIRIFEKKCCYDHAAGKWYRFIGHYWQRDELNHVLKDLDTLIDVYSKQASRQGGEKVKATRDGDETAMKQAAEIEKIFLKKISLLQKRAYRKDVIEFSAAGGGTLGITGREWDSNPYLIACPNGVMDLSTAGFRDGRPEDYIKTACPTPWKSLNEPAPEWEKFLTATFDGDTELINYVNRLMGYSSSGLNEERVTPIFFGIGWNGKGTQLEVLGHTLGDLAGPVPAELLVKEGKNNTKSAGAPSPEIMMLRGKRLVWASETNRGGHIDSGKLKWLSGGDTMVGRPPYGKRMVHFTPTHTLFLMTNYKPKANSDDFALWGRIHLIPFELSFVDNPAPGTNQRQRDKHLLEKLKKEASGILAWIVRGYLAWKKEGLNPPPKVLLATEEYRKEQDSVRGFITANFIIGPDKQVKAGDFQKAYKAWCEENGIKPEWGNIVGQRMAERFEKTGERPVFYKGLGLISD
ncbi:MAG: phage/plasmid primase, P4 family [Desulfobaccales bacterium]